MPSPPLLSALHPAGAGSDGRGGPAEARAPSPAAAAAAAPSTPSDAAHAPHLPPRNQHVAGNQHASPLALPGVGAARGGGAGAPPPASSDFVPEHRHQPALPFESVVGGVGLLSFELSRRQA